MAFQQEQLEKAFFRRLTTHHYAFQVSVWSQLPLILQVSDSYSLDCFRSFQTTTEWRDPRVNSASHYFGTQKFCFVWTLHLFEVGSLLRLTILFLKVLLLPLFLARMEPAYRMGPPERDDQVRTPGLLIGSLKSWGPTESSRSCLHCEAKCPSMALCCDGLPRKQG